jgi:phosphodiesterase/alkaline phosphatase D-like protein
VTRDGETRRLNTDMMIVLGATGCMASPTVSFATDTKIPALKTTTKYFYRIIACFGTNATCTMGY